MDDISKDVGFLALYLTQPCQLLPAFERVRSIADQKRNFHNVSLGNVSSQLFVYSGLNTLSLYIKDSL